MINCMVLMEAGKPRWNRSPVPFERIIGSAVPVIPVSSVQGALGPMDGLQVAGSL